MCVCVCASGLMSETYEVSNEDWPLSWWAHFHSVSSAGPHTHELVSVMSEEIWRNVPLPHLSGAGPGAFEQCCWRTQ